MLLPFTNSVLLIGSTILVGIVICGLYYYYYLHNNQEGYRPNNEHVSGSGASTKTAEVMLFYADWCPHCKTAKPEWEQVKAKYNGKVINGYTVTFIEYNCSNNESAEINEITDKFSVTGYPTIKMVKDDEIISYEANPTADLLSTFIDVTLQ